MATLSALVNVVAQVQGLEENQVLWVARYLREAGLIATGGRGRGGARMSAADAANLLIGVNTPGSAKQSVEMVQAFRALPVVGDAVAPVDEQEWEAIRVGDPFYECFARGRLFGAALEAVIGQFMSPQHFYLSEVVSVSLSGPQLVANVYIGDKDPERAGDIETSARFAAVKEYDRWSDATPDQQVSKSFTHRTLASVGSVLLA